MKHITIGLIFLLLFATTAVLAKDKTPGSTRWGKIAGHVIDAETMSPIPGASVTIVGTQKGDATDTSGAFTITSVPVGNYVVRFNCVGYAPSSRTDVIVRSKRVTFLEAQLKMVAIEMDNIIVSSGYFSETTSEPTSTIGFTSEEIRRAPGSAGDVSRIVTVLPSIAKVNDQMNSLVVRGGTPTENGFYLDNIEIPNINHYPLQGSSGGPIGLLNVDFIRDVTFSAGGFSAMYGDRLSSIMDLSFREGNREEFDGQLDLHFAGYGATVEGPLGSRRGSWLLSVRRSFLDLLVDAIGTGVAPKYSDYQGKVVYDISPSHQLTALGILGVDAITFDREQSEEDGNSVFGTYTGHESTAGLNWRWLWNRNGFSNTSISHLSTGYDNQFFQTKNGDSLTNEKTTEQKIQVRNVNRYRFNESHLIDFGVDGQIVINDYDLAVVAYPNAFGDTVPALTMHDLVESPKAGAFVSYTVSPFSRFTTTLGARFDYFDYNEHSHVSPRFSCSYQLTDRTSINGATGIYYQNLPLGLLAQTEANRLLNDPSANHYILGVSHLLTENTKLTVEGYLKQYSNFPMDPAMPQLFVSDELVYQGYFANRDTLVAEGKAEAYGVEVTVQKRLVEGTYGLISGSYFKTRYRGLDGAWRRRVYDNQYLFSVEGGYKPNHKWEFSLRWIFAGGPPYTPLNIDSSEVYNRSVIDSSQVNEARYPNYHSLNVRLDRRFHFSGSNLIVYFSIWNFYNRENVSSYYWNEIEKKEDVIYQWSMLPIFGLEYEF